MKLDFYQDPGHGWVKVKRTVLARLGIQPLISMYSRQRGDYVFLEEDGDLGCLHQALRARGETLEYRYHHTDKSSKIRRYERYAAGAP